MPHAEEARAEFSPDQYPPFPAGFPTVELVTLSLAKLTDDDAVEKERAFEAFKTRGFAYLELPGTDDGDTIAQGADELCRVAEQIFRLDAEEKRKYLPRNKELFGYKAVGVTSTDKNGTKDTAEFFNISKDDMIAPDAQMQRPWPAPVMAHKPLFAAYNRAAHATGLRIMDLLADKLGIAREQLRSRHRLDERAGDHVRLTRGPPRQVAALPEIQTPSHTDFGTITLLMNWLGGLQVWSVSARALGPHEPDGPGEWLWVKPKPRCAIVNLGDAAVKFTNGVLCSGRHRVVPAPGEQGKWPRYSVVYFVRPTDHCRLKTLKGAGVPPAEDQDEEGIEAKEWIFAQASALGPRRFDDN
nr:oxidoreductase vrti [Quercus suber]